MVYACLRDCVLDLERHGRLVRVREEVDPHLEMAEVQRRVYAAQGPAVLFERVKGSPFPAVCNLFGTLDRCHFLFRDSLERTRRAIEIKADPISALRAPLSTLKTSWAGVLSLPRRVSSAPVLEFQSAIDQLPQIQSWPDDGGPFITLPQVLTEDPDREGPLHTNLGIYRLQLRGNQYRVNQEVGLHFQIHRGIGVHYAKAVAKSQPLRVSVFVGGPPAHVFAAVMPLPEGMSELIVAGMLAGRRFRYLRRSGHLVSADADFCILGKVTPGRLLPEGPFGDHLGYYSLRHDFPVLEVEAVYHKKDAIWPFTVVGRPPQEDTSLGALVHELTRPMVPKELPGVHELHAVDAAGVHPLMLAIGSERYVAYEKRRPRELMTQANAILGFGQASLAKFLWIVSREDDLSLSTHDVERFFAHVLQRVDLRCDLHFQTRTTIDTLDYSGTALNEGSKLVVAAAGARVRTLARELPSAIHLPPEARAARLAMPGVLVVEAPPFQNHLSAERQFARWSEVLSGQSAFAIHQDTIAAARLHQPPAHSPFEAAAAFGLGGPAGPPAGHVPARVSPAASADSRRTDSLAAGERSDAEIARPTLPWIVVVDDAEFAARNLRNFLWVTFTRANPSHDVHGVASFIDNKHWGCNGSLIVDARLKPHHAPPLIEDPQVARRVDRLFARGGPLQGIEH